MLHRADIICINLVLLTRIELVIQSYQDCGIPLTYKSRGVSNGERSHTTAFTERGANLYTIDTIKTWSERQDSNLYNTDLQSDASPFRHAHTVWPAMKGSNLHSLFRRQT